MMPTRVTDLLPDSIAQWFVRRRSNANGSVPADDASTGEREEERPAAPPAKRPRYEDVPYYAQNDQPPAPPQPEPVAGPSGYKSEPPLPAPPPREPTVDAWRGPNLSLLTCNRSVIRHSLGEREPRKKKDSPLKPAESPVKQSVTVSGSPFYRGRTMYGGAGASSMYMYEPNIRERRTAVPSQPLCNVDNSISHTTRRLMGILERCSTPSFERKTPQVKSHGNMSESMNATLTGRSIASFNSSKTQELHISHLPTLLKLKQGARMRESTRAARHVANTNSPGFTPYTPVAVAPPAQHATQEITSTPTRELPKQTNKIKSQIGRSARKATQNAIESEIAPPLNLPEVTLKIDQANMPKFSFTAPTVTKKMESTEIKKTNFKFSMPTSIMENHINIPSDMNTYKFSKPAEVRTKKLTNGPFVFGVTKASTETRKTETIITEKKSSGWKCKDSWIVNKESDLRCVACTASRPIEKPEVGKTEALKKINAKDWQCRDCSVFNKDADEKCSCGGAKGTGKTEKSIPLVVKQTKDWRCDDCWVQNKEDVKKCAACGGSKPGAIPEASKTVVEKDWKCSDCWVMNKDCVDKCAACGGSKPGKHKEQKQDSNNTKTQNASGFEGFIQSKKKQWTCSDCWVGNEESAEQCVACGGANPTKKSETKRDDTFAELVKKQSEQWECPSCLTRNNSMVSRCACCEATRPGSNKHEDVKFNFSATPAFKFGIQSSVQDDAPKVVEKAKEIESNNNNTSKTVTFTFGVPKPADEKGEEKETPKFAFGKPAQEATTPAFKFNAPETKGEETQKDKSKTEVDGVKSADNKGVGFKLPMMNASGGLFTFNAQKPSEPEKQEKSQAINKPPSILPVLPIPTTKTPEDSSKPPAVLFGITSTAAKTPAAPLFGTSSPKTDTTVASNSTLFGIPPTKQDTNATSSTPFGLPSTTKTESATTTSLFGNIPSAPKIDANTGGMFGIPPSKPAESLAATKPDGLSTQVFAVAKTEAQNPGQQALFTFGATTQGNTKPPPNRFNFSFGATPSEPTQFNTSFGANSKPPPAYGTPNTSLPAFGATNTQASALPSFGSLTTQANATVPTFGSLTTQAGSTPAFGSLTTQVSSTPAFGSLTTQASSASAFGSLTTQVNSTPGFGSLTTQVSSTPAFGSLTTSAALPGFGSLTTQTNVSTPSFGSTQAKTSAPTFGSLTTQANVSAPTFGSLTTQANPPAFGSTTQANAALASSFGSPSANMFGSQPQSGLFGATGQLAENKFAAPAAKPAFGFGASNNSLFGSQNQTANVFGSNQTQSMFNAQPSNPGQMGMFGSPAPAFGSASSLPGLGQPQAQLGQPQAQLGQPQAQLGQQNMLGQSQAFNFGSPNAAPVFSFGQQAAPTPQASGMFNFGGAAAPNVQFNLGSSTGSPQTALQPGRKLRKAVRRTQR